jgi:hypothetical protein
MRRESKPSPLSLCPSLSLSLLTLCLSLRSGVYTVRGVTYLEGQYHEDRLVTGMKCEIFIEVDNLISVSLSLLTSLHSVSYRQRMSGVPVKFFAVSCMLFLTLTSLNGLMM